MLRRLEVSLRVSSATGTAPQDLLSPLVLDDKDQQRARLHALDPGFTLIVDLLSIDDASVPSGEALELFGERRMREAASWLAQRPQGWSDIYRGRGYLVDVCMSAWIDEDRLDLRIPPELSRVCAEAALAVVVFTND